MASKRVLQLLPLRASSTVLRSQCAVRRYLTPCPISRNTVNTRPQAAISQRRWNSTTASEGKSSKIYNFEDVSLTPPHLPLPTCPEPQLTKPRTGPKARTVLSPLPIRTHPNRRPRTARVQPRAHPHRNQHPHLVASGRAPAAARRLPRPLWLPDARQRERSRVLL